MDIFILILLTFYSPLVRFSGGGECKYPSHFLFSGFVYSCLLVLFLPFYCHITWMYHAIHPIDRGIVQLGLKGFGLFTEFKSEILRRPSSRDDNPSWRRYFSSLRTRSITRSTSSLASMAQWSKSPILTQDFTILPWISMRPVARANFLALELLIRYEQ